MDEKLKPKDIAVTNSGTIVISETHKHILHIVNHHGFLIQFIIQEKF
jgi:hypothetical protein